MIEITNELFKAVDEKKIASIMTLDQSSAFDCVQHALLLEKLHFYNLHPDVIAWVKSYLDFRTQFVEVGTARSRMYPMDRGVPQGSVLGPLLYAIFTNEMSQAIIDPDCNHISHQASNSLFNQDCNLCGNILQYADDSTYQVASKHRGANQSKLTENLNRLGDFLIANELIINKDKTQIMEIMVRQKCCKLPQKPSKT